MTTLRFRGCRRSPSYAYHWSYTTILHLILSITTIPANSCRPHCVARLEGPDEWWLRWFGCLWYPSPMARGHPIEQTAYSASAFLAKYLTPSALVVSLFVCNYLNTPKLPLLPCRFGRKAKAELSKSNHDKMARLSLILLCRGNRHDTCAPRGEDTTSWCRSHLQTSLEIFMQCRTIL